MAEEWAQAVLGTATTWDILGRAMRAQCQGFLVYTPNTPKSSEHPKGGGRESDWMGGWISCQSDCVLTSSASAHIGWDAQQGLVATGAPLPRGAMAGPEVVKAARAQAPAPAAGVPPSGFLPAAFDRFLSVTTPQAWTPAQPHLV